MWYNKWEQVTVGPLATLIIVVIDKAQKKSEKG
jgi:hypothetical protein